MAGTQIPVERPAVEGGDTEGEASGMRNGRIGASTVTMVVAWIACTLLPDGNAWAHCDSVNGPVIREAVVALEKRDVTPILKWVREEYESEIIAAFDKAVAVRGTGSQAKELADQYFLETLVRLHRAGEGEPYTGIKEDLPSAIVAMADAALAAGSVHEMIERVNAHAATAIEEKFRRVSEAGKKKDTSVAAGREYVEAYVSYTHFVEGIHAAIVSSGAHGHGEEAHGSAPHGKPETEQR